MKCFFFGAVIAFSFLILSHGRSHALDNPAWEAQRIQAEKYGDEDTLRWLDYVRNAGSLYCTPIYIRENEYGWTNNCPEGSTFHQSCCGIADAYEADEVAVDPDGTTYAVLTCNEPRHCEEVKGKIARTPGSRYKIPPNKVLVNHDPINNTGHGVVWISPYSFNEDGTPVVYCFSFGAGG